MLWCVHTVRHRHRDQDRYNHYRSQWESVFISVSVQYEHLHTILYNPFFIGVCVCVSVWQCERIIMALLYSF